MHYSVRHCWLWGLASVRKYLCKPSLQTHTPWDTSMLLLPEASSRAPETVQAYILFPGRFSSTYPTLHFCFTQHSQHMITCFYQWHTCRPVFINVALATELACNSWKASERSDTEPETLAWVTHGERHKQYQTTTLSTFLTFLILFQEMAFSCLCIKCEG